LANLVILTSKETNKEICSFTVRYYVLVQKMFRISLLKKCFRTYF